MDSISSPIAKAPKNAPRDLQSRLYREIGISAVAAALESATFPVDKDVKPAPSKHALGVKAA